MQPPLQPASGWTALRVQGTELTPQDQQTRQGHQAVVDHHSDGFPTGTGQSRGEGSDQRQSQQRHGHGTDDDKPAGDKKDHVDQRQLGPLKRGRRLLLSPQQTPSLLEQQQAPQEHHDQWQCGAEGQPQSRSRSDLLIQAERL